jgi:hypothetical protein
MLLLPAFVACKKEQQRELPKFSEITLSPSKAVYALGDTVQASITMLSPGDPSLKKATYWYYTSWWGSDPEKTADFCTPDTIAGTICFTSGKIALTQAGEVRIYFWGRLEYPNWDFQPIQIPVTLNVE